MRLGVDFGTTNSAIALFDGKQLIPVVVDRDNENPHMLPSLIYIDRKGRATVGASAAALYLEKETGRPTSWRTREVGDIQMTVASFDGDQIDTTTAVTVLVDEGAHGRLIQSIKRALFNPRYEGTHIFGKFYRVEDLIALILRDMKHSAEAQFKKPITQIVLGRPVYFSPHPLTDSRAEAILLKAAYLAGFSDVTFEREPVGVAYLYHRERDQRQTVLVFDFGGGTLDLTIAEIGGTKSPRIIATGGVQVGGDDLDRRMMEALLPHFGGGDEGHLAPEFTDRLLAWQTMPELSRPRQREIIRNLIRTASDPTPYRALETLVTHNIGFRLFKEIERVKMALSHEKSVLLHFEYGAIQLSETISRRRFERMIAAEIAAVDAGVARTLAQAQMSPEQIDVVLRTGGSSQVPAFQQVLAARFGAEKLRAIEPLVSVTGGFAVVAHEQSHVALNLSSEAPLITGIVTGSGRQAQLVQMRSGERAYSDWNFTISRMPAALDRLTLLQLPNHDRDSRADVALQFCLEGPARVYIAFEAALPQLPLWLRSGFRREDIWLEIEDEFAHIVRTMTIYSRNYPAGVVNLGGNQAGISRSQADDPPPVAHYMVIVGH